MTTTTRRRMGLAQKLELQRLRAIKFNELDGPRLAADLMAHRSTWRAFALWHGMHYELGLVLRNLCPLFADDTWAPDHVTADYLWVRVIRDKRIKFEAMIRGHYPDSLGWYDPLTKAWTGRPEPEDSSRDLFGIYQFLAQDEVLYRMWWD